MNHYNFTSNLLWIYKDSIRILLWLYFHSFHRSLENPSTSESLNSRGSESFPLEEFLRKYLIPILKDSPVQIYMRGEIRRGELTVFKMKIAVNIKDFPLLKILRQLRQKCLTETSHTNNICCYKSENLCWDNKIPAECCF